MFPGGQVALGVDRVAQPRDKGPEFIKLRLVCAHAHLQFYNLKLAMNFSEPQLPQLQNGTSMGTSNFGERNK